MRRSSKTEQLPVRRQVAPGAKPIVAVCVALVLGWLGVVTQAEAQTSPPGTRGAVAVPTAYQGTTQLDNPKADENESAVELQQTPTVQRAPVPVVPPQPFMREVLWSDVIGHRVPDDTPSFFRDSLVQVVARTYLLSRDAADGSKSEAMTGGGWIAYRSGLIGDFLGIGGAYYTSQKIFADPTANGTLLLTTPDQGAISVLGQAYVRARVLDNEFVGGRELIDTPLINPRDNRMVPITYEAATLNSVANADRMYDYSAGYIWNAKLRDSNDFISMSDALAGPGAVDRGAPFAMVRVRPVTGLAVTVMDYNIQDYINTGFAQAEYAFQTPKGTPQWGIGANIIDQQSQGADLLTGLPFETYQASGKGQVKYMGWTAFVAGSATGNQSGIFSPFGTKPNYTDMQQVSFDRANEKAVGASAAYDFGYAFGKQGLTGLSVGTWYSQGWDAIDPLTMVGLPNRSEFDVWLTYRPTEGPLKGFRLRVQYADVWQQGNVRDPASEFRFIVDYTVLFKNR
jgi:hypothetical protein